MILDDDGDDGWMDGWIIQLMSVDGWMYGVDEIIVAVEYPTVPLVAAVALETMMTPSRNNERGTAHDLNTTKTNIAEFLFNYNDEYDDDSGDDGSNDDDDDDVVA